MKKLESGSDYDRDFHYSQLRMYIIENILFRLDSAGKILDNIPRLTYYHLGYRQVKNT